MVVTSSAEPVESWWGVCTTSLSHDGVAPSADWARWERLGRVPASGHGNGFATNFTDDLSLLASLGFDSVRLTIEWARIEPAPGRTDATAIDHHLDLLRAARSAGLRVVATLVSQTLPGWFADDAGSFRDEAGRSLTWPAHVDRCAELFDPLVDLWVPIDDPIGWAVRGHLLGSRPPGRRDPQLAVQAAEAALLADHEAWRILSSGATPVMCVRGVPTVFGHGPRADDQVRWWRRLLWDSWIGMLGDGEVALPDRPPIVADELEGAFDLIGIVADAPVAVDAAGGLHPYPPDGRRDASGMVPWPEELGAALQALAERLPGRPLVVAGTGVTTDDDDWREELLRGSLGQIRSAHADGVAVAGVFVDSAIDGYDGPRGFTGHRGLLDRDRRPKPSAEWLVGQGRPL